MTISNAVSALAQAGPGTEIWWDSSPLVYQSWLDGPGAPHRDAGLFELTGGPAELRFGPQSLLRGATTNQPLTQQVVEHWPAEWSEWVARASPLEPREALWRLFIEVAARGADMLAPIFEQSDHRWGQICCQVDPRDLTNLEATLEQARRIHAARPSIMVKLPGTAEGIECVRLLSAEGIPTNVTLGFTVSQLVAVGEAAAAGLEEAQRRGTDLRNWRSCAVMMLGRFEDAPEFAAEAHAVGLELSPAHLRWAGIAIFRHAHRLYRARGYPTKLMAASMRVGPVVEGMTRVWHLEKLAGANAVLTVFPNIFEAFLTGYSGEKLRPQIDEQVPDDILQQLLRVPYFATAYDERGLPPEEWVRHPALRATAAAFTRSMEAIEQFATRAVALAWKGWGEARLRLSKAEAGSMVQTERLNRVSLPVM
jgi:transaldolase